MSRNRILSTLEAELRGAPADLIAAYVYGSVARDTARDGSDVDVALLYRREPARELMSPPRSLEGELERRLGLPVEAVVLNSASPDLVHRVLRDGVLVLDRDRSMRIRFEVKARNEFLDLLPILDRYRRVIRARR